MWKVEHPAGQGEINALHVPVDTPVRLILDSQDVIHSFYVPALRLKNDVVPGLTQSISFTANRTGTYPIECAEFCGNGHSRMLGAFTVLSRTDYARWLAAQPRGDTLASAGARPTALSRISAGIPGLARAVLGRRRYSGCGLPFPSRLSRLVAVSRGARGAQSMERTRARVGDLIASSATQFYVPPTGSPGSLRLPSRERGTACTLTRPAHPSRAISASTGQPHSSASGCFWRPRSFFRGPVHQLHHLPDDVPGRFHDSSARDRTLARHDQHCNFIDKQLRDSACRKSRAVKRSAFAAIGHCHHSIWKWIGPLFGDCDPKTVTPEHLIGDPSDPKKLGLRPVVAKKVSESEAHRVIKV